MKIQDDVIIKKMLHCEKCSEVFSNQYERCPKCGSTRFVGYTVVNPIARLPMESILRLMGHIMWMFGTGACIALLWQTDSPDTSHNLMLMFAAFVTLFFSVFISVAMFGMGEMLKRIIRIQRRLRAMFEDYQGQGS